MGTVSEDFAEFLFVIVESGLIDDSHEIEELVRAEANRCEGRSAPGP